MGKSDLNWVYVGTITDVVPCRRSSIRRIVITSSCGAVVHVSSEPKVFSELDWNEQSIQVVEESGKAASPVMKYRASKTLAEKGILSLVKSRQTLLIDLSSVSRLGLLRQE